MSDYTLLDALAEDLAIPSRVDDRDAILSAIRAATISSPFFHAGTMRPGIPEGVDPHRIGAIVSALVKTGVIVKTGEYALSGNGPQRNTYRPVPWYRVTDQGGLK
ncbi:MAG: hypothetical protein IMZ55_10290 [Acidobacteria bacterium]|nr:hypothetical protein [Acidobacteriota bacterium]